LYVVITYNNINYILCSKSNDINEFLTFLQSSDFYDLSDNDKINKQIKNVLLEFEKVEKSNILIIDI
jgi:hypothetical protein